jgi:uncharacterized protein (DUF1684 family)
MSDGKNSSNVRSVQAAMIAAIFVIIPIFMVLASMTGERRSATVKSDAGRQTYVADIDAWHQKRITGLKREHGWLSLIALNWLKAGKNPIDSIGTVTLNKGVVVVDIAPGVKAMLKGAGFVSGPVKTDADTSGADKIIVGSRAFAVIKRGEKYALRIWDADTPSRTHFTDVDRYPVSERWRISARWEPYAVPKNVTIETVVPGITEDGIVTGAAVFMAEGKEQRLEPVVTDSLSDYFFVISDATNGRETYGGGRFLDAAPPENGTIILDFNKMTNPPCAFTAFATCPRPLPGNRLSIRIDAGEKKFGNH